MKKYFLDFGTQHGCGLKAISTLENFDQSVEIHSFEANPNTFKSLQCDERVHYHNIGISAKTGFCNFNCEEEREGQFTGGGSSLLDLSEWNTETVYHWKEGDRFLKNKSTQVFCLSIVDLLELLLPNRTEKSIIAKFDVEGSEYSIFEMLEKTDNFKWFSKLYVEFHDHCIQKNLIKDSHYWLASFAAQDIEFVPWH
jgi:FkbM family methyltransferase